MAALPRTLVDREQDKFREGPDGRACVAVCGSDGEEIKVNFAAPNGPYLISEHTVTTTSAGFPATPLANRVSLAVRNLDATNSIYIVNAAGLTTAATKWEVGSDETINFDIDSSESIYLVADTNVSISIMEIAST